MYKASYYHIIQAEYNSSFFLMNINDHIKMFTYILYINPQTSQQFVCYIHKDLGFILHITLHLTAK